PPRRCRATSLHQRLLDIKPEAARTLKPGVNLPAVHCPRGKEARFSDVGIAGAASLRLFNSDAKIPVEVIGQVLPLVGCTALDTNFWELDLPLTLRAGCTCECRSYILASGLCCTMPTNVFRPQNQTGFPRHPPLRDVLGAGWLVGSKRLLPPPPVISRVLTSRHYALSLSTNPITPTCSAALSVISPKK